MNPLRSSLALGRPRGLNQAVKLPTSRSDTIRRALRKWHSASVSFTALYEPSRCNLAQIRVSTSLEPLKFWRAIFSPREPLTSLLMSLTLCCGQSGGCSESRAFMEFIMLSDSVQSCAVAALPKSKIVAARWKSNVSNCAQVRARFAHAECRRVRGDGGRLGGGHWSLDPFR